MPLALVLVSTPVNLSAESMSHNLASVNSAIIKLERHNTVLHRCDLIDDVRSGVNRARFALFPSRGEVVTPGTGRSIVGAARMGLGYRHLL